MKVATRGNSRAHLDRVERGFGNNGRIYGTVEGQMSKTWWHPNGAHNTFRDLDLPWNVAQDFVKSETEGLFFHLSIGQV